jgi:hypothetical protein
MSSATSFGRTNLGFGAPPLREALWRTRIEDLDGDGRREVLVAAFSADPSRTEQLFCFSANGKMLWRYQPQADVEFGTPGMNGPWSFKDILVTSRKDVRTIWIAFAHSVWWPSFVVRLSAAGIPRLVFANPGTITSLRKIETDSGSYILATGVNNAYARAFVAMLAEDTPSAMAPPATQPGYRCARGCPGGRPYRYILLPRSEVSAALLPYSVGEEILTRPGGLTVITAEVPEGNLIPGGGPSGFFYFSNDLHPEGAAYADGYRQVHQSLERRGLIRHSFKDCPEQKSPAILDVCDENGHWSQVAVPRVPASN